MILIGILHFFKMCPSKQSAKADQSVHGEFSRLSAQRTEACVVLNVSFDTTLRVTQSTVGKARFVRNNKKSSYPRVLLSSEWSRRGSNPRPNNGNSSFLHAYFLINFRSEIGQEHPVSDLATEFS